MRDVAETKGLLDLCDLLYGVVKSVFAEGSVLDVFELVAHLVKLAFREGVPPRGETTVSSRAVWF